MWRALVWSVTGKESDTEDSILTGGKNTSTKTNVNDTIAEYLDTFKELNLGRDEAKIEARKTGYTDLVRNYYNLSTDFYEYGKWPVRIFDEEQR